MAAQYLCEGRGQKTGYRNRTNEVSSIEMLYNMFSISMAYFTQREKDVLEGLKRGKRITRIAEEEGTGLSSISDSVARIRGKLLDFMDGYEFLARLGIVKVEKGRLTLVVRDPREPWKNK